MARQIVLGNHLVPEILAHLGKLAPLPADGLLAGQALASAILDLYGSGGGVYNDIDIFLPASPEKLAELASDERRTADALALGLPRVVLDEYKLLALDSADTLRLVGSEHDGLINRIWCDTTEMELTPGRLVYSFDLNANEVALDLRHHELTWTRAFEEFLAHRELEITSLASPERTLLRYLKKRQELAAFGNDALVLEMVCAWRCDVDDDPALLPARMQALAERFWPQLSAHFEREDNALVVRRGWTTSPAMADLLAACQSDGTESTGLTRLVPLLAYARARQASQGQQQDAADLVQYFEKRNKAFDGAYENVVHLGACLAGAQYLRGQRSTTHRDAVLRALDKHEGLNGALMGLSLEEQYRCVLDLAKRAKSMAGPLVYGLAETMATPVDMWNAHHREQFFRVMAREVPGGELCPPWFEPFNQGPWSVCELRTTSALRAEGLAMQHCVGGYANAVKSGRSRILSLRNARQPKWAATAELQGSFKAGGEVRIAQHRTYLNRPVAKETEQVLRTYLEAQAELLGFTLVDKKNKFGAAYPF